MTDDTAFLAKLFFSFPKELQRELRELILKSKFEFKIFTIGYFLYFLKNEKSDKFNEFALTCINQIYGEVDSVPGYSDGLPLTANLDFNLDKGYIKEKLEFYIKDCELFNSNNSYFPKFTYIAVKKCPLEILDDFFLNLLDSTHFDKQFHGNYSKAIWFFQLRATDNDRFKVEKLNFVDKQ